MQSTKAFSSLMQSLKPDLTSLRVLTENQQDPDVVYDPTEGANWVQRGLIVRKPDNTLVGVYHPFKSSDTTITIPDTQEQSDWNQTDNTKADYIKNKPLGTKVIDFGESPAFPNDGWTQVKAVIDSGLWPIVKYDDMHFTPAVVLSNYMRLTSLAADRVANEIELYDNNDHTYSQAHLMDFNYIGPSDVDNLTGQAIWESWSNLRYNVLHDSNGNYYIQSAIVGGTNTLIFSPINRTLATYSRIEVKRIGPSPYTYTKTLVTSDDIWAHWQNDDGYTTAADATGTSTTLDQSHTTLAEGSLASSATPRLPAGLYRFSCEIAATKSMSQTYTGRMIFDIQFRYNSVPLRSVSFNLDASIQDAPSTFWFGGVFRMSATGDIDIVVIPSAYWGQSGYDTNYKMSHLFVNKIGN